MSCGLWAAAPFNTCSRSRRPGGTPPRSPAPLGCITPDHSAYIKSPSPDGARVRAQAAHDGAVVTRSGQSAPTGCRAGWGCWGWLCHSPPAVLVSHSANGVCHPLGAAPPRPAGSRALLCPRHCRPPLTFLSHSASWRPPAPPQTPLVAPRPPIECPSPPHMSRSRPLSLVPWSAPHSPRSTHLRLLSPLSLLVLSPHRSTAPLPPCCAQPPPFHCTPAGTPLLRRRDRGRGRRLWQGRRWHRHAGPVRLGSRRRGGAASTGRASQEDRRHTHSCGTAASHAQG